MTIAEGTLLLILKMTLDSKQTDQGSELSSAIYKVHDLGQVHSPLSLRFLL